MLLVILYNSTVCLRWILSTLAHSLDWILSGCEIPDLTAGRLRPGVEEILVLQVGQVLDLAADATREIVLHSEAREANWEDSI